MPPRISLATLIGIVAILGLSLAGMLSTSRVWLTLASTATLCVLLAALLASGLFSGIDRAFWVGFALFGWTYLIMVNWDWVGGQIGHDLTVGISEAADWVLPEVNGPSLAFGVQSPAPAVSPTSPPFARAVPAPPVLVDPAGYLELARRRQIKVGNFVQIGRNLGALCFALVGGWIGRMLAVRAEASERAGRPASAG